MTKALLLSELNKNNDFNEISPQQLENILGKSVYLVHKIIVSTRHMDWYMFDGTELDCPYLTLNKEYVIHLSNIDHGNQYNERNIKITCEGYNSKWGFNINTYYNNEENSVYLTLSAIQAEEDGTPDSCYININLDFGVEK